MNRMLIAVFSLAVASSLPPCHAAPAPADYLRLLEKWLPTARSWTHPVQGEKGLAFYGTGGHQHWAVQAHCTATAAIAILATDPDLDEKRAGESRQQLRRRALSMLRYALYTHKTGSLKGSTGESWGYSWISALALERMAHACTALKPWLTDDDRQRMRKLLIAECDYLLNDYPVVGAIDAYTGKNKPESNIWNGCLLYRTAIEYPDAPHAAKYRQKATALLLNGISIPSDANSDAVYSGRKLSQWHVGPNYTEQFGLNHHGYLNLGYMEICLSNVAMLHFYCQANGLPVPEELYHHVERLWALTKSLTFNDGRLWRIGGDTRVRYCYCQDYAFAGLLMISDHLGDPDAERFETGWLSLVAKEQASNPDGAFLSGRLARLREISPFYYCRLEGDRAATMSMGAYYRRLMAKKRPPNHQADIPRPSDPDGAKRQPVAGRRVEPLKSWFDEYHGAAMVNGDRRRVSWVWEAAQRPCGTLVPADRSDLVEWQWNLAGLVQGTGGDLTAFLDKGYAMHTFDGGFATAGSYCWNASLNPGEGSASSEEIARTRTAMVALPDDATVVVLQQAHARRPVYINRILGLNYNVPNDVFNGGTRQYTFGGQDHSIAGAGGASPAVREIVACGKNLRIDGRVSVTALYGAEGLSLFRPGQRNALMSHNKALPAVNPAAGNLYCDVVCMAAVDQQRFYDGRQCLYDIGALLAVDFNPSATVHSKPDSSLKVVEVAAADGQRYLVAANFAGESKSLTVPLTGRVEVLCGKDVTATVGQIQLDLPAGEVAVARLKP
jgi:hypothetical protein